MPFIGPFKRQEIKGKGSLPKKTWSEQFFWKATSAIYMGRIELRAPAV
jgi:hypothetical protein